jgi:hypothetical protein
MKNDFIIGEKTERGLCPKMGRKKNAIDNCEDCIDKSHRKGNVLTEPYGSAEHSLHTTGVSHSFFACKLPSAYSCHNHLHFH